MFGPDRTVEGGNPGQASASAENERFESVLRQLGELLSADKPVDWQESRRWCSEVLESVIARSDDSQRLSSLLDQQPFKVGGDEHHVVRMADGSRVFKFTHGDNFGCRPYFSPHDPECSGKNFHGSGNADPFFYLTRWWLLNHISHYQTRFEGLVSAERAGWLPRFCVSQPWLEGENPSAADVRLSFARSGFVEINEGVYIQKQTQVLLTDAYPRNVRIFDGVPVPFDAIAQIAPPEVVAWVAAQKL